MKSIISILFLGLCYCILAPLLFLVELHFAGAPAHQQIIPLSLIGISFFTYTLVEFYLVQQVERPQLLTQMYLVGKVLRLILTLLGLVVYLLLCGDNKMLFTLNLFFFYLFTVIYTSVYYIQREHKQKNHS